MLFIITLLATAAVVQPQNTIDPSILTDIFGTPSTPTPGKVTTPGLEDVTIRTTDSTSTFVDTSGAACKCVPYYLCDADLVAIDANNASITGWGELDIRFGEEDCQESVERCCKNPKTPDQVVIPTPDPTQLKGCGYRNPKGLDFTITGGTGTEAEFGEFPWVVALLGAEESTYEGVGSLIHPRVVLTSAHISYKFAPGQLKIRAGEWDTQTVKERLQFQERFVDDIRIHKDFQPKSLKNNVAVLRLSSAVELAAHINVVCLPAPLEDFSQSRSCVANGWGKDVFGKKGRYAVILKRIEIDMVAHDRCNALLKRTRLGNNFKLHSSFVCAGGEEGKDTCKGDGGAPLACPIGDDRYKLTGLVSWGIGCGQKDVPAVYAAVAVFRPWIDEQVLAWGFTTEGYNV